MSVFPTKKQIWQFIWWETAAERKTAKERGTATDAAHCGQKHDLLVEGLGRHGAELAYV